MDWWEQFGTPLELYNSPDNVFVAGFIGSPKMNSLKGIAVQDPGMKLAPETGDEIVLPSDKPGISDGMTLTLGIRPNGLQLSSAEASDVHVDVRSIERLEGASKIYADAQWRRCHPAQRGTNRNRARLEDRPDHRHKSISSFSKGSDKAL